MSAPLTKKFITTVFLLVLSCTSKATTIQQLDSFVAVLKKSTSVKEKLNCLYTLSYEYGYIEPRKGLTYGALCLDLANKQGDHFDRLNAYNGIANCYETMANFDSARYFHQLSYECAKKMGSPPKMALTLFNVALCYKQQGDYKNTLNQYLAAYKLLEKEKGYNPRIHFYMGEMYMRLGDYDKADQQSRMGIKKCTAFGHTYVVYNMYVNLARCHMHFNKLDSATLLLDEALKGLRENTDITSLCLCLNALGELSLVKKEYQKALNSFSEELTLHENSINDNGIHLAYINKALAGALCSKNAGEIRKLIQMADNSRASISKNSDILLESYGKQANVFELINDPKNALLYYKRYSFLNDSLLNKQKIEKVLELQAKYEIEKKEQLIKTLEQNDLIKSLQIETQESQIQKRNLFIILCIGIFVLVAYMVYLMVQKQKEKAAFEKELAVRSAEEKERLRIAKDIHDDLGSGLSKINFLSEMISGNKTLSSEAKESSVSISETSKKLIVNMRDLIWALDPDNVTLEGLVARIREYSSDYLEDFSAELRLSSDKDIPDAAISKESYRGVLMTVKESLNNIVKHSKATLVEIESRIYNDQLSISVKDNGIGIGQENGQGNGLRNMRTRIESLGGHLSIETKERSGTLLTLKVPIEKMLR